jgi:hypothetical protein
VAFDETYFIKCEDESNTSSCSLWATPQLLDKVLFLLIIDKHEDLQLQLALMESGSSGGFCAFGRP